MKMVRSVGVSEGLVYLTVSRTGKKKPLYSYLRANYSPANTKIIRRGAKSIEDLISYAIKRGVTTIIIAAFGEGEKVVVKRLAINGNGRYSWKA